MEKTSIKKADLERIFKEAATDEDKRILEKAMELILLQKGIEVAATPPKPIFTWGDGLKFTKAIQTGDVTTLKQMLDTFGADADIKDEFGFTNLMYAISWAQKPVAELFLERGANVNELSRKARGNEGGGTALMVAVAREDLGMVQLLLTHKADVNIVANNLSTALSVAMDKNNALITNILIASDASMEVRDKNGATPLIRAVAKGDKQTAERMLKAIYDKDVTAKAETVNMVNTAGKSALMIAVDRRDADMIGLLLKNNATLSAEALAALKQTGPGLAEFIENWPKIRDRLNEAKLAELQDNLKKATQRADKAEESLRVTQTRVSDISTKVDGVISRKNDLDL